MVLENISRIITMLKVNFFEIDEWEVIGRIKGDVLK